jgi:hypothetical protein
LPRWQLDVLGQLFADAKGAKDLTQQIVAAVGPCDLSKGLLRLPQFLGCQFARSVMNQLCGGVNQMDVYLFQCQYVAAASTERAFSAARACEIL